MTETVDRKLGKKQPISCRIYSVQPSCSRDADVVYGVRGDETSPHRSECHGLDEATQFDVVRQGSNESANRVGEYPCLNMYSANASSSKKFSGLMPFIFHVDILRGKDCRWECTNSWGWQ